MLRASSLGLSFPLPNIFAVHSCRRLCGAKRRWVPTSTATRNCSASTPPSSSTHNTQKHADTGENLRVADPQISFPASEVLHAHGAGSLLLDNVEEVGETSALPAGSVITEDKDEATISFEELQEAILEEERAEGKRAERHAVSQPPPYAAGRPWAPTPVKPVKLPDSFYMSLRGITKAIDKAHRKFRRPHPPSSPEGEELVDNGAAVGEPPPRAIPRMLAERLRTLGSTTSVEDAWDAYVFLIDVIANNPAVYTNLPHIPFAHLHRLGRILASNRPKTHRQFLRLLSVLTYIKHCGGDLHQYEWNALVDHAGKGWRKTSPGDVSNAMNVFNNMLAGRLPGAKEYAPLHQELIDGPPMQPDIYTLTSLLTVAARAGDSTALRNISTLMGNAGLKPNRITHLALLRYFTLKQNLGGVRSTLQRMIRQGLELGLDGLNACIWAYGRCDRLDIVLMIFRLLRHNKFPEEYRGEGDVRDTAAKLAEEFIFVEPGIIPNEITYTTIIQTMSYHGHFRAAIDVFIDMLTINNEEQGAPLHRTDSGDLKPAPYNPTMSIYRAIFLGFSKHAVPPYRVIDQLEPNWTLDNLNGIFERFLALPKDANPTHSIFHIIMTAYDKATDGDLEVMRKTWEDLDERFGIVFSDNDPQSRLFRMKLRLFSPDKNSNP